MPNDTVQVPNEQVEGQPENKYIDTSNMDDISLNNIIFDSNWMNSEFGFLDEPSEDESERMLTNISGGIFGMPYQFPQNVDTIPGAGSDSRKFGRKYQQKIASVMPVMFITPGEPLFMGDYSDSERKSIKMLYDSIDERNDGGGDIYVDDILNGKSAPFYIFNSTFPEYCKYVNIMVRALSSFMGLSGLEYTKDGDTLWNFNLQNVLNPEFAHFFDAQSSIAFYLDSEASVSESFGNSSTESQLLSKVNSLSDTGREINFIFGAANAGKLYDQLQGAAGAVVGAVDTALSAATLGLGKGLVGRVANGLTTVISGGKMVFPKIWSSSDYSRSYSLNIKLRSPDPDPLSILLNIYVPLCCLTCLAMGKQIGYDANSYNAPFLVRATYKSVFNCEMGLISSLSITKGGEDLWNAASLPTSVDVNLTIEDLYSTMFMSKNVAGLMNNISQLDYLALAAGIDVNKDWVARNVKLRALLSATSVADVPLIAWQNFKNGANKALTGFLGRVLGADIRWNR